VVFFTYTALGAHIGVCLPCGTDLDFMCSKKFDFLCGNHMGSKVATYFVKYFRRR